MLFWVHTSGPASWVLCFCTSERSHFLENSSLNQVKVLLGWLPHPSVSLVFWYRQKQSTEPGLFLHSNLALGQVERTAHSSISTMQTQRGAWFKTPQAIWFWLQASEVQYLCSSARSL